VNAEEYMRILDNLQSLLENQIEMARKGNFRRVEALAEQADPVVEKIIKIKEFENPEFNAQREHLIKLYKKLELMIAAGKDSISKQLKQVVGGKKILKVYYKNR